MVLKVYSGPTGAAAGQGGITGEIALIVLQLVQG